MWRNSSVRGESSQKSRRGGFTVTDTSKVSETSQVSAKDPYPIVSHGHTESDGNAATYNS